MVVKILVADRGRIDEPTREITSRVVRLKCFKKLDELDGGGSDGCGCEFYLVVDFDFDVRVLLLSVFLLCELGRGRRDDEPHPLAPSFCLRATGGTREKFDAAPYLKSVCLCVY